MQNASTKKNRPVRVYRSGRLAYYRQAADAGFWDTRWNAIFSETRFAAARQGEMMPTLKRVFLRHLPRQGRILEAGCGLGTIVMALRAFGYDVEGVEWAEKTVLLLRQHFPDLPIRTGDVTALDVANGTYAGYISLGVIEHREAGPEPFLTEAFRILQPGGVACITVPHLNILRRIKARLGVFANEPPPDIDFYQYAFSQEEFIRFAEEAGFKVTAWYGSNALKGVRDEISFFRWLTDIKLPRSVFFRTLNRLSLTENLLGHMQMLVCMKPDEV